MLLPLYYPPFLSSASLRFPPFPSFSLLFPPVPLLPQSAPASSSDASDAKSRIRTHTTGHKKLEAKAFQRLEFLVRDWQDIEDDSGVEDFTGENERERRERERERD